MHVCRILIALFLTLSSAFAEDGYNYPNNKKGFWITPLLPDNTKVPLKAGDKFVFEGDICVVKWGEQSKGKEKCYKLHDSQLNIKAYFPDGATDVTDKLQITASKDNKSYHYVFETDELKAGDLNQFNLVIASNHSRSSKLIGIKSKLDLRIELIGQLKQEYQGDESKAENIAFLTSLEEKLLSISNRVIKALEARPDVLAHLSWPLQVENNLAAPLYYASNFSGHKMSLKVPLGSPIEGESTQAEARVTNLSHLNYSFPAIEMDGAMSELDFDSTETKNDDTIEDGKNLYEISLSFNGESKYNDSVVEVPFGESWEYTFEVSNIDPNDVNNIEFILSKNRALKSDNAKRKSKKYGSLFSTISVSYDDVNPVIFEINPKEDVKYVQQIPTISALISDEFGRIDPDTFNVSIESDINGIISSTDFTNAFHIEKLNNGTQYKISATLRDMPEGSHKISLEAKDFAGNTVSYSYQEIFVDRTAPVVSSSLVDGILTNVPMLEILISVVDKSPISTYIVKNGSMLSIEEDYDLVKQVLLTEGLNTFEIYSIDAAGNMSNTIEYNDIVLDTIPPKIVQINPEDGGIYFDVNVAISGSADEVLSKAKINTNEIALSSDLRGFNGIFNAFTEGSHTYSLSIYDKVGNESTFTRTVEIILNVINKDLITIVPLDNGRLLIKGSHNSIRPNTEFSISRGLFSSVDIVSKNDGSFEYETELFSKVKISAFNEGKNETESVELSYDLDTTLSGIVKDIYDNPVPGVFVKIEATGQSDITDSQGSFSIPEPITGDQKLIFDGSSVPEEFLKGEKKYYSTSIAVNIGVNQKNILQEPVFLSHMPTDGSEVVVEENSSVSVTSPHAEGVVLNIPAGSISFPSGEKTGKVSVMEIPSDKTSVPPLEFAVPDTVYSFEPSGTSFSEPVELVLPNVNEFPAGMQVVILSKNSEKGIWEIDGVARVDESGGEIVTEPGQGITHFSDIYAAPLGPIVKEIETADKVGSDLLSGSLNSEISLPTFKSLNKDVEIKLKYKSKWASPVTVVSNMFDVPRNEVKLDSFLLNRRKIEYGEEIEYVEGANKWIEPDYVSAQFFSNDIVSEKMKFTGVPNRSVISYAMDISGLKSGIYPYTSKYELKFKQMLMGTKVKEQFTTAGSTRVQQDSYVETQSINKVFPSEVSGILPIQNKRNSPFGSGWDINLTSRILNPSGGRLLVENSDGVTNQYIINDSIETLYSTTEEISRAHFSNWPQVLTTNGKNYLEKLEMTIGGLESIDSGSADMKLRGGFTQSIKSRRPARAEWHCSYDNYSYSFNNNIVNTFSLKGNNYLLSGYGVISKWNGLNSLDLIAGYGILDKTFDINNTDTQYFCVNTQDLRIFGGDSRSGGVRNWMSKNYCDPIKFCLYESSGQCNFFGRKYYYYTKEKANYTSPWNDEGTSRVWRCDNTEPPNGFLTDNIADLGEVTINSSGNPIISGYKFPSSGIGKKLFYPTRGFEDGVAPKFNSPTLAISDSNGNAIIADTGNNRVRSYNLETNTAVTIAGNGQNYDNGNGKLATEASLFHPRGLAYDSVGNLYISTENGYIRKVDTSGRISLFAGKRVYEGGILSDDAHALDILFDRPTGMVVDKSNGYLYVADTGHHRVLRIDLFTKESMVVAGNGSCDSNETFERKAALKSSLCSPTDIGLDSSNNLLILDGGHKRIRRVNFSSNLGIASLYLSNNDDNSFIERDENGGFIRQFRDLSKMYYNSNGQQIRYENRAGIFIDYEYTGDLLTKVTDAVGQKTILTYDNGYISTITDPAGRTTAFDIADGKLLGVQFADNTYLQYEYNALGLLKTEINQRGFKTQYTYNKWRRLKQVTRADGSVIDVNNGIDTTIGNDFIGGSTGELTNIEEDKADSTLVDEKGNVTSFKMDKNGFVKSITVNDDEITLIERDNGGRPVKVTHPNGNVIKTIYSDDEYHDLLYKEDFQAGIVQKYEYNKYGQLTFSSENNKTMVSNIYDETTGVLLSTTNKNNQTESFTYYDFAMVKDKIDARGYKTTFEYNDVGNLTDIIDHLGYHTIISRDVAGNPVEIEYPDSVAENDPVKKRKQIFEFTTFNLLKSVTTRNGEKTDYIYLPTGELHQIIDPNLKTKTYNYDSMGRVVEEINVQGQKRSLDYDMSGNVVKEITFSGIEKKFEYDNKSRVVKSILPDNVYEISYYESGKIEQIKNNVSKINYTYTEIDGEYYIDSETVLGLGEMSNYPGISISYDLDEKGNRKLMSTPFGNWNYNYDEFNEKLLEINNHKDEKFTFTYDSLNRLKTITRPGSSTTFNFDETSFMKSIIHKKSTGDSINNILYARNENANRIEKISNQGVEAYTFNANNFLNSVTNDETSTEVFKFDELGNRIEDAGGSYTYDPQKRQLVEDYQYSYFYDNSGNLSSKVSHEQIAENVPKITVNYVYNSENQLVQIKTYSGKNLTQEVFYRYDAMSRRMFKGVYFPSTPEKNIERKYVYDNQEVLAQYSGDNELLAIYTHSTLRTDDVLSIDVSEAGVFEKIAKNVGSFFYTKDGLGSITDIVDSQGNVKQSYVYNAFGTIKDIRNGLNDSISSNPFLSPYFSFTNREWDTESEMYYYRARYYDSRIGRFIQVDPHPGELTSPVTVTNKYIYAGNNPVMNVDPNGEFFFLAILAIISLVTDTNFIENLKTVATVVASAVAAMFVAPIAGVLAGGGIAGALVGAIAGAVAGGLAGGFTNGVISVAQGKSFADGFEKGAKIGMTVGAVVGAYTGYSWFNMGSPISGVTADLTRGVAVDSCIAGAAVSGMGLLLAAGGFALLPVTGGLSGWAIIFATSGGALIGGGAKEASACI